MWAESRPFEKVKDISWILISLLGWFALMEADYAVVHSAEMPSSLWLNQLNYKNIRRKLNLKDNYIFNSNKYISIVQLWTKLAFF